MKRRFVLFGVPWPSDDRNSIERRVLTFPVFPRRNIHSRIHKHIRIYVCICTGAHNNRNNKENSAARRRIPSIFFSIFFFFAFTFYAFASRKIRVVSSVFFSLRSRIHRFFFFFLFMCGAYFLFSSFPDAAAAAAIKTTYKTKTRINKNELASRSTTAEQKSTVFSIERRFFFFRRFPPPPSHPFPSRAPAHLFVRRRR